MIKMSSSYDQDQNCQEFTSASGSHWSNVALESFKGGSHSTVVYHLIIALVIMDMIMIIMVMIMIMTVIIMMVMIMMMMMMMVMVMIVINL